MNTKTNTMIVGALLCVAAVLLPRTALAQQSGVQTWAQTCGNCHHIQPANRYTANQWESLLMHMRITARLPDDAADAVLQFLQGGAKPVASAERPAPGELLAAADPALAGAPLVDSAKDYTALCVACHGAGGEGDGPVAAAHNPHPADFTSVELQEGWTDTVLETAIRDGKGAMPGFANQLTDRQIRALVIYLRSFARTVQQ